MEQEGEGIINYRTCHPHELYKFGVSEKDVDNY